MMMAVARKRKAAPIVDAGSPERIVLSATECATVSAIDWSFVYYHGDWTIKRGYAVSQHGVALRDFIARRMNHKGFLDFKDGNKLNCCRDNLIASKYDWVWVKGTVRSKLTVDEKKEEYRWVESEGWLFGNCGLIHSADFSYSLIHQPTGLSTSAWWTTLKKAFAGTEQIHSEINLALLDDYAITDQATIAKMREAVRKHRG